MTFDKEIKDMLVNMFKAADIMIGNTELAVVDKYATNFKTLTNEARIEELENISKDPWVEPRSKSQNIALEKIQRRIQSLKGDSR